MKKRLGFISLIFIILFIILSKTVYAKVTSNDPKVSSGGDVSITLSSSEVVYAYKITLEDSGGLTFQSATSSSGQVNGKVANGASSSGVTTLATYKFKAPTVSQTSTYSVKFNVSISLDGDTFTNITNTSKVTVNAPAQVSTPAPAKTPTPEQPKSGDATLKSITVGGKKYTGSALNSTITQTVESSVNSISISAEVNNSKAKVTGTGTKSLLAGQTNPYTLTVTAENGTKKTYKVNIIRKAIENTEPNIIEDTEKEEQPQEKLRLDSLIIKDVQLNTEFKSDTLEYMANVKNMKELEIIATANKKDAEIKIEGASELKEGDNYILITAVLGEETVSYKINVFNQIEEENLNTHNGEENENVQNNNFSHDSIKKVIIENWLVECLLLIIIILAIISIILAVTLYKYRQELEEINDEELIEIENFEKKENDEQDNGNNKTKEKIKKIGKHF